MVGRPSVAVARRRQIVAATIQCMAVYGADGITLERIAATAGMARGHVRHFTGNRDELLNDAARVFYFGESALDDDSLDTLAQVHPLLPPAAAGSREALDYLFGEFAAPTQDNAAALAFIVAAKSSPMIRSTVVGAYRSVQARLVEILQAEHSDADPSRLDGVASAVLSIAIGVTLLADLDQSTTGVPAARSAAASLIGMLD